VHGGFTFCITVSVVQLCGKNMMPTQVHRKGNPGRCNGACGVHGGFTFCITVSVVQLCGKNMMPLRYTEKATQDGAMERAECMEAWVYNKQGEGCWHPLVFEGSAVPAVRAKHG